MDLSVIPDLTMQGETRPGAPECTLTAGRLAGLIQKLAARPDDWWHLVRFDGVPVPVRFGGCELWLSAWPPGHHADPHADVLGVLAGELTERRINALGVAERTLRANRIQVYGGGTPRELVNPGPAYAISLHATSG